MKQINELIVVEVPTGSQNHAIVEVNRRQYCQWAIGKATGMDILPPAGYEIIGLYSEACIDWAMLLRVAFIGKAETNDSLNDFLQKSDIPIPTDTTDLLFIHKLK